jgi:lipopolysaccharide transport system permease protein
MPRNTTLTSRHPREAQDDDPATLQEGPLPETVIERRDGVIPIDLGELWSYRELLYFLVWRDVKIRYKQTVLGAAWAILQPLMLMIVFSLVFGRLGRLSTDGLPMPVFYYAGLLPWLFFSTAITQGSNSMVANERLITKIYFPRLLIPLAACVVPLIDFAIAFVILAALMAWYGIVPAIWVLTLPLWLAFATVTAFTVSVWLSALNIEYRDVRYTLVFLVQFWMFASPVAYPSSMIPEAWRPLYGLNPMAGVIEGFRWGLTGQGIPPGSMMAVSALVIAVLLVLGLRYFRRTEGRFADVI